jgi:hypothetical protein
MTNLTAVEQHEQKEAEKAQLLSELEAFLVRIQKLLDDTVNKSYTHVEYRVRFRNDKPRLSGSYQAIDTCRIYAGDKNLVSGGVYCFVALKDNSTKSVGRVKKGDVLKAASYKTPAKHARGNIYDDSEGMASLNWTGPSYL